VIVANTRKMRKLVDRLDWDPPDDVWVAYGEHNTYTGDDARRKDQFVGEVAAATRPGLVWDLGANNGRHSPIAAEHAGDVVAIDADHAPVELLYRELRAAVVVEFPTRDDPMVETLLAAKREGLHPDYERDYFERCLHEAVDVQRSEELGSGMRVLYYATRKTAVT
jgi:hypothetical protein